MLTRMIRGFLRKPRRLYNMMQHAEISESTMYKKNQRNLEEKSFSKPLFVGVHVGLNRAETKKSSTPHLFQHFKISDYCT